MKLLKYFSKAQYLCPTFCLACLPLVETFESPRQNMTQLSLFFKNLKTNIFSHTSVPQYPSPIHSSPLPTLHLSPISTPSSISPQKKRKPPRDNNQEDQTRQNKRSQSSHIQDWTRQRIVRRESKEHSKESEIH